MKTDTNILIYQMGKVGSVSIQLALKQKGLHGVHGHWMQNKGEYPTTKKYLVEEIKSGGRDDWKVICLVREPLARNVSAFFQSLEKYYPDYRNYKYKEAVLESFLYKYNHHWPDLWFDLEIMDVFDFDPFSERFPRRQGYQIYEVKHGEILIIRLEDADKVIPEAIEEFLEIKGAEMATANSITRRHNGTRIGKIYNEFMETAQFPEGFLNAIYDTRYAKHFYSKKELKNFKRKWSDNDKRNR